MITGKFEWQTGYSVPTKSQKQIHAVANDFHNQEELHSKNLHQEFIDLQKAREITYNPEYLPEDCGHQ